MNNSPPEKLGLMCKALRESLGRTQGDVAEDIGCSRQLVTEFENGRTYSFKVFYWYIGHGLEVEKIGKD